LKTDSTATVSSNDALIIADVQKDFLPGGALGVKDGDQIIPVLNEYARIFKKANAKIIASRDWHPPNHMSFTAQGGPWPPHCVQNSDGAEFHPDLKLPEGTTIVSKATDPAKEAYSVFDGTGLAETLKSQGVTRVFVGGLATDYCVVNTVLDAVRLGFDAMVLMDAVRGIDVTPGDVDRAVEKMVRNGAGQVTLADFPESPEVTGEEPESERTAEKPLARAEKKKKARLRSRGPYRKARVER
jgi:nicotinamidase-related amidase